MHGMYEALQVYRSTAAPRSSAGDRVRVQDHVAGPCCRTMLPQRMAWQCTGTGCQSYANVYTACKQPFPNIASWHVHPHLKSNSLLHRRTLVSEGRIHCATARTARSEFNVASIVESLVDRQGGAQSEAERHTHTYTHTPTHIHTHTHTHTHTPENFEAVRCSFKFHKVVCFA